MSEAKQRAVVRAEKSQIERVRRLVDAGQCRTVADFVRDALEEKLARAEQAKVAEAVDRYCSSGHANEDVDLVDAQDFTREPTTTRRRER